MSVFMPELIYGATGVSRGVMAGVPADLGASRETVENMETIAASGTECFHPRRVLVRFKPSTTPTERQAVHDAVEGAIILTEYHVVDGLQLVEVPEDSLPAALAVYKNHPDVRYAERDYAVRVGAIPDDPDFDQLWGLHNTGQTVNGDPGTSGADIRTVGAWDIWTGDPDFRIAVIDTGVDYDHTDLQSNIWTNRERYPATTKMMTETATSMTSMATTFIMTIPTRWTASATARMWPARSARWATTPWGWWGSTGSARLWP
jgi:subtilisin family serine protease